MGENYFVVRSYSQLFQTVVITDTCEADSGTWSIARAAASTGTPGPSEKDGAEAKGSERSMSGGTYSADVVAPLQLKQDSSKS